MSILTEIKNNPRTCGKCGEVETPSNIVIAYKSCIFEYKDEGCGGCPKCDVAIMLCDDCLPEPTFND